MKNNWLNKILPHIIAIIIFLVTTVIFFKPVLDGKALNQHDMIGWKGMAQNSFEVKEHTGKFPLWNTHVFSGMPNYQIALEGKTVLPDINKIMGLGLPKPISFFFIAAVCFYILCLTLGLRPIIGILGALAYAFSTYNPVILSAGHETKMMAIAYMPLLLSGILLIYQKRYWIGLSIATLGAYLELMANHPQVNYYFFIIAGFITIFYLISWIKNREFKHLLISFALVAIAALVGIGSYSLAYLTTKEYTKYTMRGGKTLDIKGADVKAVNTKGLDADYALSYSMKPAEPLVMLMPNAYGGSSLNTLDEKSHVVKKLSELGIPETSSAQLISQLPKYWGGMSGPGEMTSGPPYIGAIIFILAIIGFVIIKHPVKWGLLAASVLAILMAWGKFFPSFNHFLLNTLPLYNKFRAPSMALIVTQLAFPVMAVLTVHYLFFAENAKEHLQANFKKILYTLAGIGALLILLYIGQSYASPLDDQILQAKFDQSGTDTINRAIIAGMKADRQSLFGMQVLRTIIFMALVLGALYAYLKNIVKPVYIVATLAFISFIDLWVIDKKYLGEEHFVDRDELQTQSFTKTPIDEQILQDKNPHYRVFDISAGFNDNRTAYFHRSVLGYHPAKLRIYQDVIERYFDGTSNEQILNALDTKYIINQNAQGQLNVFTNTSAYGPAWFVKAIKPVTNEVEELQSIGHTNLKDTAIILQANIKNVTVVPDSSANITLTKYTNDEVEYHTTSSTPQFAVLSEVYYPAGWNAYIDGKQTNIIKTDYFLRGVQVPPGKHSIQLVFEPSTVQLGIQLSYISSILMLILFVGGLVAEWLTNKNKTAN